MYHNSNHQFKTQHVNLRANTKGHGVICSNFLTIRLLFTFTDSTLIGHVLVTYDVKEFHQCITKCTSHPECKSINYKYSNDNSSLKSFTCELNDATKTQRSTEFFILRTGYFYYEMVITEQVSLFCILQDLVNTCIIGVRVRGGATEMDVFGQIFGRLFEALGQFVGQGEICVLQN